VASATVWVATYTGTVSGSRDDFGLFGGVGSSLDGDRYTARYIYDTASGERLTDPGVYDELDSG
jgi:hypothetical protein